MNRPLALWQKLLVLLLSTALLPACSSMTALWNTISPSAAPDAIEFSHAEPQAPVQLISKPLPRQWSPTTWVQAAKPIPPDIPPRANAQPLDAIPALTVYFDNDRDQLIPSELERLKKFATGLRFDPTARLEVSGHTDNNQTADYNIDLSRRRSETVRSWLVQFGAPEKSVTIGWYGLHQPASDNLTEEGRALNRRVEIRWTPK